MTRLQKLILFGGWLWFAGFTAFSLPQYDVDYQPVRKGSPVFVNWTTIGGIDDNICWSWTILAYLFIGVTTFVGVLLASPRRKPNPLT